MTKAEIMKAFDDCKDIGPFKDKCDWFLNFLNYISNSKSLTGSSCSK